MAEFSKVSVTNLLRLALPMMLTAMSTNLMYFCDRFFLAQYSLDVLNAVTAVSLLCATFQFFAIGVASISEVFVGQYNGAGLPHKIGNAVWQLLWFSIFAIFIFLPLSFMSNYFFLAEEVRKYGSDYYQITMMFGWVPAVTAALSGFFVGRGRAAIVTLSAIIANIVNIGLNYVLIFGYGEVIPALGAKGAAIATVISTALQAGLLLSVFLSRTSQKHYLTYNFAFKLQDFKKAISIGGPNAIGHSIEIYAWCTIAQILSLKGSDHLTIYNLASMFFVLFAFITEGIQKGVIAFASNLVGAGQTPKTPQLFKVALTIHAGIMLFLSIPLIFFPEKILGLIVNLSEFNNAESVYLALKFCWFYFLFDGMVWIIAGMLTAVGDTRFIMITNAGTAWTFAVLPVYLGVIIFDLSPAYTWGLIVIYAALNFGCFLARYHYGSWRKFKIA